jgi:hypothetical protein
VKKEKIGKSKKTFEIQGDNTDVVLEKLASAITEMWFQRKNQYENNQTKLHN